MAEKNLKNKFNTSFEEEIDLFDLLRKIWKWKWLTISLTLIVTLSTYFYVKTRPNIYTVKSTIKIGKVANTLIDDIETIKYFLKNKSLENDIKCFIDKSFKIDKEKIDIISVSYVSDNPDLSYNCINTAIKLIINRDNEIYSISKQKMDNSLKLLDKKRILMHPTYTIEMYNFRTYVLKEPVKPGSHNNKRIKIKITAALLFSIFIGIFFSYILDMHFFKKLDRS